MAGGTREPGSGVLDRAARILAAFSTRHPTLSVSGIAERSGLPRSTVHRIASELVAVGYLRRGEAGYEVATKLYEIGVLTAPVRRLADPAGPAMRHLSEVAARGAVRLYVLDGEEPSRAVAVLVGMVPDDGAVRGRTRMGGRSPLTGTAEGRALVLAQDDAWCAAFLRAAGLDVARAELEISRDRERGHTLIADPGAPGRVTLAAPLRRIDGLPSAALVVDVSRQDRVPRAASALGVAAREVADAASASA